MRVLMLILTLVLTAQRGASPQNGVVAGQLSTADGKPAVGIRVSAMVVPESNNPATSTSTLASIVQTDASGRYRLEGLPAGRYYIVAGQVEFPTYYPGVAAIAQATPVTVAVNSGTENLALNFALSRANQDGVIEVLVTAAGAPLRGAQVTLLASNPVAGAAPTSGEVTDAEGKASFQNLFPGNYTVRAQLDGYLGVLPANIVIAGTVPAAAQQFSMAPVTITPGQPAQKISLALNRGHAIGGAITDASGLPVIGLRVSAALLLYVNGRPTLSSRGVATTDDRGQYRLFWFGPGEYYIVADSTPQRGGLATVEVLTTTYYPGTTDLAAAKPAVIRNGDITGIDFTIQRIRNYRVTGTVLNPPARTLPNGQVANSVLSFVYTPRDPRAPDSALAPPLIPNRVRGQTGEFDILVPAGEWNLFAVIPNTAATFATPGGPTPVVGAARYITGRTPIDIIDKDVDGVTIRLSSSDVKGRVVIPANVPVPNIQLIRPSLQPRENLPAPLIAQARLAQALGPNGEFQFPGVPPGSYSLIMSLPAPIYVSDIRLGQKSIMNDGILNVGSDPVDPLEIILGSGSTTISGSLRGITPETTVGQLAATRVVLVPEPPRRNNTLLYRIGQITNLNGSFFFSGVAPGAYKIFVLVGLPPGSEQDPEVLRKYEDRGSPITITPGQTAIQPVQLEWTPDAR